MENMVEKYLANGDWKIKENANHIYCSADMAGYISGKVIKDYWLNSVFTKKIKDFHESGKIHLHDLSSRLAPYCSGFSTGEIIRKGLKGPKGRINSAPPKHMNSAMNQLTNFIGIISQEFCGAVALNNFSLYLAPFVYYDKLDYKQVKQNVQSFCYHMNQPNRWAECVTEDTEVLTPFGFKSYIDLKEKDDIYTWNNGKLNIQKVKKINIKKYNGEMHSYTSRDYIQTVTPNHRILRRKNNKEEFELIESSKIVDMKTPISLPIAMLENNLGDIKLSNEQIELLVFILTEGCIDKKNITISKSIKRWGNERLKELFKILNIKYSVRCREINFSHLHDKDYGTYLVNEYRIWKKNSKFFLDILNYNKKDIPTLFLKMNKQQAELFINTWAKLDGHSGTKTKLQCDNYKIADKIQHIMFLAGYGSRITERKIKNNVNPTIYVYKYYRKIKCSTKVEKVNYNGIVWCPTTDDGIVVYRKEGKIFISGNSPFSNVTIDLVVPEDLKDFPVVIGGEDQTKTYKEFEKEMNMINEALLDVLIEGDANGTPLTFPIMTIGVTPEFPWESEIAKKMFQVTAKYGTPFFENFANPESGRNPKDSRSLCCRLSLKKDEMLKHTGGIFGNGDSMGSIGVATINLNRIGYEAKTEEEYFKLLEEYMIVSKDALELRRKVIDDLYEKDMYPYTKFYLKNYKTYFSTIGVIGGNESMLNFMKKDLMQEEAIEFTKKVLEFMNKKCKEFQLETGNLYNLEAVPGEGCMYSLALKDKEAHKDIILSGKEKPYLTNACLPPVEESNFLKVIRTQEDIQSLYTGGSTINIYLGEKLVNYIQAKNLVKKLIVNTKIPYFSITPTYSICPEHNYIAGENYRCPTCNKNCEVFSRVVGYLKPKQRYNPGKLEEFKQRKYYNVSDIDKISEEEKTEELFAGLEDEV